MARRGHNSRNISQNVVIANPVTISGTVIVDGSAVTQPTSSAALEVAQGADAAAVVGPLVQGVVNESPQPYVTGFVHPLSLTSEGRLRVEAVPISRDLEFFVPFNFGQSQSLVVVSNNPWGL